MTTRILAIHAHPDDLEILAAGTLALLALAGHEITMVTMTGGDKGSDHHSPEEISEIRRHEAASAARLIGAKYQCAGFLDLEFFSDNPSRKRVVELLRRLRPELVITAPPVDYMCDHETTSDLVRDACFAAPAPNYFTDVDNPARPMAAIPHLYFTDPLGGVDRENQIVMPDFVVNIESTFATKTRMLAEHRSQREWLQRHHGMDDYIAMMEELSRSRGRLGGVKYGEGFRLYKGHPYPQSALLQELVGTELIRNLDGTAHSVGH
jgi:N-acetylglucosamine malate deacetylase 1